MIKNILCFGFAITALLLWTKVLQAQFSSLDIDAIQNPVVIELYTSQSCSSCPPADRVLSELAQNQNVIALGFHVTYWDHLHWKDTLSRNFSTQRQRAYSSARSSRRVYTPQMIVNGKDEFVGSNRSSVNNALNRAHKIQSIPITISNNTLNIHLKKLNNVHNHKYDVWLYGIKSIHNQHIPSGENRGTRLNYTNSVLSQASLGQWDGYNRKLQAPSPIKSDIDTVVVIVQEENYGPIVAAGTIRK